MTAPERMLASPRPSAVLVAGVPWPRYKLVALIAGFATLLVVGILTASAAPSVLTATAVGVVAGLTAKTLSRD